MDIMQKILDLVNEVQGTEIKMGEEFKLKDSESIFKFNDGAFYSQANKGESWWEDDGTQLKDIITKISIIETQKKRWEPDCGEIYFLTDVNARGLYELSYWQGDDIDKHRLDKRLIFKTKEEAIEMSNKLLDYIKELRENE